MIEVLVAATILMVIVMMLAMLFQQTSIAWRTGARRADAFTQVRSMLGAIQRDAAKAVDERTIKKEYRDLLGGETQNFKGFPLAFYTLSGAGFEDDGLASSATPRRSLSFVKFSADGKRSEKILLVKGSPESVDSSLKEVVEWFGKDSIKINTDDVTATFHSKDSSDGLPMCLKFQVSVTSKGYNLEIGAASAGPDGAWGTKDDIRTWADD